MKTLLEQIEPIDYVIRQLHKIDSKLQAGQFIAAWRENRRLTVMFEDHRKELLNENKPKETTDGSNDE